MNAALFWRAGPPREKRAGAVLRAPAEKLLQLSQNSCRTVVPQEGCDTGPLVCGAERRFKTHELDTLRIQRESRALLCLILRKISEIEAKLQSPLTARQLHWRYCAKCGERVTNANVGGYEGRSALSGRLFCQLCADEIE
jgi:hypothetical protein